MAFWKSIEKTFRDTGRDLWQKIEEPSKENLRATVESLREQLPAAKQTLKDAEHKLSERWTAVSETFGQGDTSALTEHLVDALTPFPTQQKIQPDTLENLVLIQRGGFGDIYRGWSRTWSLPIALKMIRGAERDTVKELKKEAEMMQLAHFPYVLRLLGLYQNKEGDFVEYGLVMEYMPNGSLYTLFKNVTPVPWALRFQILHQVALGMNYLHSLNPPLLHLDLKPKNVLLDQSLDVHLADFGLSKLKSITSSFMAGGIGGTWPYMPPEAITDLNYTPKEPFDVYSYGILTWSVLAAEEPYPYAQLEQIKWMVPQGQRPNEKQLESLDSLKMMPEAKTLMRTCWDQEPEARPPFTDCIRITQGMFDAYKDERDAEIRSVQDIMKCLSSRENEDSDLGTTTLETSPFSQSSEMPNPSFFKTK